MDQRLVDLTRGYRERINRLAIFEPLYELNRKLGKDHRGNTIDWFSLGLLTLLFFFESMLTRRRQTSAKDLALYFQELNKTGPIFADEAGFIKIAREIIETFRDASGKKKEKVFFNWDTRQQEQIYYSLLEVRESNLAKNIQYYRLTERGLELIFATKEYFSEFQLSINQLMLRKQLEKGELNSALREIDEMRIAVEELRRKMIQLNHEVQRNIISHETQSKYMKMLEDTHARLAREHEEFTELHGFVVESKKKFEYEMNSEKEQQAYGLMIEIAKELEAVHHLHRTLLDESIGLKRKAMQAARESLYHAGLTSFNFNQDVASRVITSPLPTVAVEGLARPFLGPHLEKGWSPLEVFAPQRMSKTGEEDEWDARHFVELAEDPQEESFWQKQRSNIKSVAALVREMLGKSSEIRLSEVVALLQTRDDQKGWLEQRAFYDFWLVLHQHSPVKADRSRDDRTGHLLDEILGTWPGVLELEVLEDKTLLKPVTRYKIQEMILYVRMNKDAV